jgi:hypothetical protein
LIRQTSNLNLDAVTAGFSATLSNIDSMRIEAREGHVETTARLGNIEIGISNLSHLADTSHLQDTSSCFLTRSEVLSTNICHS